VSYHLLTMRLTPDGKITIPLEICEQLGLSPETELEFGIENNRLYIEKKQLTDPTSTWIKAMRGTLQDVTTDEIMTLTRHDETP
jgi:bifunctional DNA-binding transcriptional regulator/antitoxin component of YhaV-PrlF toxin-antitoxin module